MTPCADDGRGLMKTASKKEYPSKMVRCLQRNVTLKQKSQKQPHFDKLKISLYHKVLRTMHCSVISYCYFPINARIVNKNNWGHCMIS